MSVIRFQVDPNLSDEEIFERLLVLRGKVEKHGGPGPHKGTGTDQSVHGKGGSISGEGGGETGSMPDSAAELLAMNDQMETNSKVQYPEDVKQAAADLLQTAIYREAELSPIVQAAAGNAEFKGWDHRIKYTPSIASKITRNMKELESAGLDPDLDTAVEMVTDLNRYTLLSDNESFIRNFSSVVDDLERAGWESWDHKIKNYFAVRNDSFDGIVSKFRNSTGAVLEIQFHTKNSAEIAELSHDLYNVARELPAGDPRRAELAREMVSLWNSSSDHIPEGVFEIGSPSEQLFKRS